MDIVSVVRVGVCEGGEKEVRGMRGRRRRYGGGSGSGKSGWWGIREWVV